MNIKKINSTLNDDIILLILDYSNYYREYHAKKLYNVLGYEQYKKTTYIHTYISMGCNLRIAIYKREKRLNMINLN